jgi:hypothetical protein
MKLSEIMLVVFVGVIGVACGFAARNMQAQSKMVKCVVSRVIDSPSDEPSASGEHAIPYTIVSYKPQWEVFVMPGVLGDEGQYVWITPPSMR